MKRYYLVPTIALLALVLPVRADKPDAKTVTVPFELLKSKHMAVQVKLNGKGPFRLIFDTGAPMNVIGTKAGKEAGLIDEEAAPALPFLDAMGQSKIKKLEIADLKAEDVGAMVMDHPTVVAMAEILGPIDGIVGFPLFARYEMTIDYQAKKMTFTPTDYKPSDDLVQKLMGSLFKRSSGPRILVPAAQWGMTAAKDKDDEDAGVTIKEVLPDSPAEVAGLKAGDRLLTIDGRWTDSIADLYLAAGDAKPGKAVPVTIKRGGKEMKLSVTPRKGI